jgi:hypothetical protein
VPRLRRLISVGGNTAGFVLPIFRAYEGSNQELVQQIDELDNVISFEPLWADGQTTTKPDSDFETEVGRPAIWAFRDQREQLHIGTATDLRSIGLHLLATNALDDCPMAAAEMAAFCKAEAQFPNTLRSAFEALRQLSQRGADTWRDAVILLPAIKRDLVRDTGRKRGLRALIDDVVAITREGTTRIYAPAAIASLVGTLPYWRTLAGIFGITNFEVHAVARVPDKVARHVPTWSLFGIGGIARFVITRPPFSGLHQDTEAPLGGAIAHGPSVPELLEQATTSRLLIAVVGSDIADAHSLASKFRGPLPVGQVRHVINVRPLGFGTPSPRKASPTAIRDALGDIHCLWIMANHRLRQTGTFALQLSVSNTAARFVQAGASGLIACLGMRDGGELLKEAGRERGFGLIGAARYSTAVGEEDMIRHVLHTMLCEDAILHSASKISLLWPHAINSGETTRSVKLGNHKYQVELITRPKESKLHHVVGFAMNVRLSPRSEPDFRDFCISLIAGYGWQARYEDGQSIVLENEGEPMRIWPVTSSNAAAALLRRKGEFSRSDDLIISNQSISKAIRERAAAQNYSICHYSEIGRWMRSEYGMRVLKDL